MFSFWSVFQITRLKIFFQISIEKLLEKDSSHPHIHCSFASVKTESSKITDENNLDNLFVNFDSFQDPVSTLPPHLLEKETLQFIM